MALTLDKVIERNSGNTIDVSTSYSELNTKAQGIVDDIVANTEANATAQEAYINTAASTLTTSINALVNPSATGYNAATSNWRDSMMSKAGFNALAEERKANRAGSGFDEYGKHAHNGGNLLQVNEGIHTYSSFVNAFFMGEDTCTQGVSKTIYPLIDINGVSLSVKYINNNAHSKVLLPQAPTVLPHTATLTQQQIDSGVIKHADASNSGLITNGKFTTDTSGWTTVGTGTTITSVSGVGELSTTASYGYARQTISTVVGKKYIVEFNILSGADAAVYAKQVSNYNNLGSKTGPTSGVGSIEFIATESTTYIWLYKNAAGTATFDSIAVFPADAISRSDLVFLESWHEDISEKDFVYPLGNVQYRGTTGDSGTPVAGAFAGATTYSLFSDTWQADSALIGRGYVWSTLTDANKKAFVANPENNCYLDGDKVIQVRYRMRVVQGLGDSWDGINSQARADGYGSLRYKSGANVHAKGQTVSIQNDYINNAIYYQSATATTIVGDATLGTGHFVLRGDSYGNPYAYERKAHALPIALVHRRNQGAYHPTYNANGAGKYKDADGAYYFWYNNRPSFTSLSEAFNLTPSTGAGTISSGSNYAGRPDGLFYDQIHEGDITDLRNSSHKKDRKSMLTDAFNKAVAGTTRGSEGEWEVVENTTLENSAALMYLSDGCTYFRSTAGTYISEENNVSLTVGEYSQKIRGLVKGVSGQWYKLRSLYNSGYTHLALEAYYGDVRADFPNGGNYDIMLSKQSTRTKSNTLLHCDIIGNPANYPTAWKESGIAGTPLLVGENGEDLIPDGTYKTFKMSRKVITPLPFGFGVSSDNGATWNFQEWITRVAFDTTTNSFTFPGNLAAGTLLMVFYTTHTNMAESAVNSEVLEIGKPFMASFWATGYGSTLGQLINKVLTGSSASNTNRQLGSLDYTRASNTIFTGGPLPSHQPFTLGYASGGHAVKTFPYLTKENGKAYMNLVFKEMIWDVDSGDDSKFDIVNNVSTATDDNANVVLIGQKRIELPYFIGEE